MVIKKLNEENIRLNYSLSLATKWILNSGLQINKKNNIDFGAVYAWYDAKYKKYSYLYSEITGYYVTLFCFLFKLTKKKIFLSRAENAAQWLINIAQCNFGGFKCLNLINRSINISYKENLSYNFDNGVILNGLINLYKINNSQKILKSAIKCGNWILKCLKKNGSIYPVYNFKDKKFIINKKEWSLVSGPFHSKVAIGLYNLYDVTKDKKYFIAANKIIKNALSKQSNQGNFKCTEFHTNLHPHCYSMEGLWVANKINPTNKIKTSIKKGIKWSLKNKKDFIPPRIYYFKNKKVFNFNFRLDALSQVLRLMYIFEDKKIIFLQKKYIKKNLSLILKNQSKSLNKKQRGGFFWGNSSNGKKSYCINSWTTAFVIQLLYLYLKNKNNDNNLKMDPYYII